MRIYRVDVFVLTIGWLSVVEYYVAEARHRHGHDEDNTDHKRRHRHNRHEDGWRPWGQWSACNAECGTGVSLRIRECSATSGSQYEMCRGRKKQFKICNTQECVRGQKSLRAIMCSAHDNDDMGNGKRYRWLPYLLGSNRCELTCRAAGRGFYNSYPEKVTNGSLCNAKGSAVCIDGVCTKFGCDEIVGSHAVVDRCGVCGGDGNGCRIVRERYDDRQPEYGYSKIGSIPAGATYINITQLRRSRNYLALKITNGAYIINGNRRLSPQGEHRGAGTTFIYHRTRSSKCGAECVYSDGPTNAAVDIMLLAYGTNGGIRYSYAVPVSGNNNQVTQPETTIQPPYIDNKIDTNVVPGSDKTDISYNVSESNSTHTNSGNSVVTYNTIPSNEYNSITIATTILQDASDNEVTTFNDFNNVVPTVRTGAYDVSGRTPVVPARGNGRGMPKYTQSFKFMRKMRMKGRRKYNKLDRSQSDKRYKNNRRYPPIIVEDHFNGPSPDKDNRPVRTGSGVIINVDRDEGVMITGDSNRVRSYRYVITGYTPCSRTCDTGRRQPIIRCMAGNRHVNDNYCRSLQRPSSQPVECNSQPCQSSVPRWNIGDWTSCSVSCGEGTQQREVDCVQEISPNVFIPADDCQQADEPWRTRSCRNRDCSRWQTSPWSQCSVTCGTGIRRRQVSCVGNPNSVTDGSCDQSQKPPQEESCFVASCGSSNTSNWYFNDWPAECPVDCGAGKQTRQAVCMRADDMTVDTGCSVFDKPQIERDCKSRTRCGGSWFTGPWGKCNVTCGTGVQSRDIACVHRRRNGRFHVVAESNCPADDKPEAHMACTLEECSPEWFMSDWNECSSSCGPGRQTRDVKCLDGKHRRSSSCTEPKPATTQQCDSGSCNTRNTIITTPVPTEKNCTDTYAYCDLVIRTGLCAYEYYRGLCCESCKNGR